MSATTSPAAVSTATIDPPSGVRQAFVCAGREVRRLGRSQFAVAQSVLFPALLLVVLSISFSRVIAGSVDAYATRLVPQLVVAGGAFGAAGIGMALVADRHSGMVSRLRTLPGPRWGLLAGLVGADAARTAAAAVVLVVLGHGAGFRFEAGVPAAVGFFALAIVFGTTWTWIAAALGTWAQSAESVSSAMNGPVLLLFFLSTGFVPLEGFPGPLQPVVAANPLSCAVNALIGLSQGGATLVPVLQTLAWTAAATALLAPLAVHRYRRGA